MSWNSGSNKMKEEEVGRRKPEAEKISPWTLACLSAEKVSPQTLTCLNTEVVSEVATEAKKKSKIRKPNAKYDRNNVFMASEIYAW
jgi:hypothetical protein